jgi:hypothetical protein
MSVIGKTISVVLGDGENLIYTITIDDTISPEGIGLSCLTLAQAAEVKRTGVFPNSVSPVLIPLSIWPEINDFVNDYEKKKGGI